ncbi:distal tail protein Dit [Jeotgalibacillus marinus]|uniref:Distal tail protein Dit n=1 Tax=Jeotgalibacillus marinus TaxID=86667 RepID=A0ABV3Q7A3_9BACL
MITFNGYDLTDLIQVTDINGRGPLSQTIISQSIPGKDGSFFQRRQLTERTLSVSFVVIADFLEDLRDKVDTLNSILITDKEVPIIFSDEPDKTYYGILEGDSDIDETVFIGQGTVSFLCSDPFKYGQETSIELEEETVVNVQGTYGTYPKLEVRFETQSDEFVITRSDTGQFVRIIRDFSPNDFLEVDFATGKIIINENVSMATLDWSNSDFFMLSPGSQEITISPSTNSKLIWTPRWL